MDVTQKIRLLIADDQEVLREGLRIVLESIDDFQVLGTARDGTEAVRMALDLRPDIVLMDLKMPILGGVEATRQITTQCHGTQVLILTTYDTDDWVYEALRAGAQGYLLKESGSAGVIESIRAVHRGESQFDPAIARKLLNAFRSTATPIKHESMASDEPPIEPLTERETQILTLIADGLANKDIAIKLFLTEGTVRNYSSTILAKLHVLDRTQAVVKAVRHGLVKL